MSVHRERVEALVAAYSAAHGEASCEAFARFVVRKAEAGRIRIVESEAEGGARRWVRILNLEGIHGYDVDVTTSPPLVWAMDGEHPEAGPLSAMRVSPVDA